MMSELIAVTFDNAEGATKALGELYRQQSKGHIELEGAAVLKVDAEGRHTVWQPESLAEKGLLEGSIAGGVVGTLVGAIALSPILGGVLGAVSGSAFGGAAAAIKEAGVEDLFMEELAEQLEPSSSALFVEAGSDRPYTMLLEMQPTGGKVLKSSLNPFDEENLQKALEGKLDEFMK
jgi:uncharacterized membrane protein